MVWTDAMREKAAATRAAKKAGKHVEVGNGNGGSSVLVHTQRHVPDELHEVVGVGFDWEDAPLDAAINRAADLKRELDRVQAIVLRRQNPPKKMWTCWTQENKTRVEIPRKVLQECLRKGEDGKWKFRDDGRFEVVDGVRTLKPAFCCNYLCFAIYQRHRVTPPAREAQVQPRT